ncbi:hypothetical protein IQ07DRAFT_683699 [Pyrenochaeta sp. DS3sAY3a]|nr:hypothetical protein IQ07DRAFT_683699 [Pyrenochaeta sp. DS3sAY3a]
MVPSSSNPHDWAYPPYDPDLSPAPGYNYHESKYAQLYIAGLSACNKANLNASSSSDRSGSVGDCDADDEATPLFNIKPYLEALEDLDTSNDTSKGKAFGAPSPTTFNAIPDVEAKIRKAKNVIQRQNAKVGMLTVTLGANVEAVVNLEGDLSLRGVYWKAPKDDETIPTTSQRKIALVKDLINSIKTNRNCKEKVDWLFLTRWADEATYYKWLDIEPLAWKILSFMVDVHEKGWTEPIFDRDLRESVQQTMFFTFQDRFQALCKLLRYEKNKCEDLLKGDRWNSIIGNPWSADGRSSQYIIQKLLHERRIKAKPRTEIHGDDIVNFEDFKFRDDDAPEVPLPRPTLLPQQPRVPLPRATLLPKQPRRSEE